MTVNGDGPGDGPVPPATIHGRLQEASRRRFVGRSREIELVRSALEADDPPLAVLFVHGPGGIGKTALLGVLASTAEAAGVRSVRLDMRTIEPTPTAFLARFAAGLGWEREEATPDALARCGRVVVLVDALESAGPLDAWLRELFVSSLPADALVVVAGRLPPSPEWSADPGWRELLRVVPLGDLSADEAGRYLDLRGVDRALHGELFELTHGHPLALSLVADVLDQRAGDRRGAIDLVEAPDVVRALIERFVDEIPGRRHREALAVCARARSTTEDLLRAAMGGEDAHELLAWLRSRSFVEEGRYGVFPHDLARDVLDADFRWRDRTAYEDLHLRVRAHVLGRLRRAEGLAQQRAAADLIYLHRLNPVMRSFFDWAHLSDAYADRLADGDPAPVLAMAERYHGPAEASLVRHWLERQPHAFVVFRRAEGDVAGFAALLQLHEASPEDIAGDPGARAMWAYATGHDPPRPGEAVTAARFVVDRDSDQSPSSPTWTAMSVAHILHALRADRPAWDLVGAFCSPDVGPMFAHLDFRRVPAAEFEVAGRHHVVFAHDWRRLGPEAWLDMLGRRELDDGTERLSPLPLAADAQAPVLSHPEFADAVRRALRDRHRPDRLRRNPLTRSRALREHLGGDSGASPDALADLLDDAAGALAADPRDAKAHRAVDRTFLRPAATQERAAEALGLPFSTYRRHLRRGVDRIVEQLWDVEFHGSR
ncbi:MAG: AAA family ATPase [Acidimicrobiia bacterium]|nr:AAA family ATPase [Acidimicrobiia bacterium]